MARWKLNVGHYLNVPGTEWEYKETDRTSGRQARKVFVVPLHLDPNVEADHNYPNEGMIVVAYDNKKYPRDYVFIGPPTPDMTPLDEEAEAISAKEAKNWRHPIEDEFIEGGGYSASILRDFERQIAEIQAGMQTKPAAPVSVNSVDPEDFARLQEQVAQLLAQNSELQETLKASKSRRI